VGPGPIDAALGDFDADGRLDLALYVVPFLSLQPGLIQVALGNGDGSFGSLVTVALVPVAELPPGESGMLRAGDVDGDGVDDLVYTTLANTPALLSQGGGSFALAACGACEVVSDKDFVLADLNADDRADLVTCTRVRLAGPGGVFGASEVFSLSGIPISVDAGDVNGDGLPDVVVGRAWTTALQDPGQTTGDVLIVRGNGDGSLQWPPLMVSNVPMPYDVEIVDLDVDGRADVLVGEYQHSNWTLRALLNATYGAGSPFLDLGGVLAGTAGAPIVLASGTLLAGEPFAFALYNGPPNGVAFPILGTSFAGSAFKGGVLIPSPELLLGPLPLDGEGGLSLDGAWPPGAGGLSLYLQFWMPNGGGPAGFVASSGVRAQIP
jgi:hypothetical protein